MKSICYSLVAAAAITMAVGSPVLAQQKEVLEHLRQFGQTGVAGHVVQVLDPAELTFPFSGRIRFEGLENEGEMLVRRSQSLREDYRRALDTHVAGLTRIVQSVGWTMSRHFTDHTAEAALLTLYSALSERIGA